MFITNQQNGNTKLGSRLATLAQYSKQLDILVGFFYFSGLKVLTKGLMDRIRNEEALHLRILVGMDAECFCGELVEVVRTNKDADAMTIRQEAYETVRKIVTSVSVDKKAFHERLDFFIELLRDGKLDMRKTREPNHAKLYIFSIDEGHKELKEKIWITGSSNFSEPGLSLRNELNVELSDFGSEEAQAYYDELWEEAIPLTGDEDQRKVLIQILEEESVAAKITPFEAFYLALKNYVGAKQTQLNSARLSALLKKQGLQEYRYQTDAVAQAMALLDENRGVIIADVVGLGKSVIASSIAYLRGKRGIIICPPGLMGDPNGKNGGWYEYRDKFNLQNWEVWSRGKLKSLRERLAGDETFEMVIVDEAHYFRNRKSQNYADLLEICCNREVMLLTATPFNNSPDDLLSLVRLFSPGKNNPFVSDGDIDRYFGNLTGLFKRANACGKALDSGDVRKIQTTAAALGIEVSGNPDDSSKEYLRRKLKALRTSNANSVRQVVEKVAIRRNRIDLQTDPLYRDEIASLSKVMAPAQQFFELTPEQNDFYDRVINEYFGNEKTSFHGPIYQPNKYLLDQEQLDDTQANIFSLTRRYLVMRFESSFGAFAQSLHNTLENIRRAKDFIDKKQCYVYDRKLVQEILADEDEENATRRLSDYLVNLGPNLIANSSKQKIYYFDNPNFDGKRFMDDLNADIALLEKVIEEVEELGLSEHDPKCEKLIKVIRQVLDGNHPDIAAEKDSPKRKVIVFSMYADTIDHIRPLVEKAFEKRVLVVDGENFSQSLDKTLKRNFDASSIEQEDEYDVILGTDKISEGFNLNRAGIVINYDIPWNPTRVIQRVGRINRIGKKVFEQLYIFNFFPTVMGQQVNQNRQIAQSKMLSIHKILGEDARIFTSEEEPTAAALYDKLNTLDEETEVSFFVQMKKRLAEVKAILLEHDPDALNRLDRAAFQVKSAFRAEAPETLMFQRRGNCFYALGYDPVTDKVTERQLQDALPAIDCSWDTRRCAFSSAFWDKADPKDQKSQSVYDRLRNYKPEGNATGLSQSLLGAQAALQELLPKLEPKIAAFAGTVIEDLSQYVTLSDSSIKEIAATRGKADGAERLEEILTELRGSRGDDYLERTKRDNGPLHIVVTVDKVVKES